MRVEEEDLDGYGQEEDYDVKSVGMTDIDQAESSAGKARPPSSATSYPTLDSREGSIKSVSLSLSLPQLYLIITMRAIGWSLISTLWRKRIVRIQKSEPQSPTSMIQKCPL